MFRLVLGLLEVSFEESVQQVMQLYRHCIWLIAQYTGDVSGDQSTYINE